MGQMCAKFNNPDYSRQGDENAINPFAELDNVKFPDFPLNILHFYKDFDKKFCVLNHILLSDYMNLLNNFKTDDAKASNSASGISNEILTKDDWMKFFDNKILKNPIISRLNLSPNEILYQKQFFDDLFDDILKFYIIMYRDETIREVPKIAFFSVGYNFCFEKTSQKLIILINLFSDATNKIVYSENFYHFFFTIISNVFLTPLRLFLKYSGDQLDQKSMLKNIKTENAVALNDLSLNNLESVVVGLANNILDYYFKDQTKTYSNEEFKKLILDEKNIWILSNNGIKMKVEEKMKEKNLEVMIRRDSRE